MRIVYVLQSEVDPTRYYIGLTFQLNARVLEHNAGLGYHTRKFKPWKLTVAIEFVDPNKAFLFERYLKTGSGRALSKRHF